MVTGLQFYKYDYKLQTLLLQRSTKAVVGKTFSFLQCTKDDL